MLKYHLIWVCLFVAIACSAESNRHGFLRSSDMLYNDIVQERLIWGKDKKVLDLYVPPKETHISGDYQLWMYGLENDVDLHVVAKKGRLIIASVNGGDLLLWAKYTSIKEYEIAQKRFQMFGEDILD